MLLSDPPTATFWGLHVVGSEPQPLLQCVVPLRAATVGVLSGTEVGLLLGRCGLPVLPAGHCVFWERHMSVTLRSTATWTISRELAHGTSASVTHLSFGSDVSCAPTLGVHDGPKPLVGPCGGRSVWKEGAAQVGDITARMGLAQAYLGSSAWVLLADPTVCASVWWLDCA